MFNMSLHAIGKLEMVVLIFFFLLTMFFFPSLYKGQFLGLMADSCHDAGCFTDVLQQTSEGS